MSDQSLGATDDLRIVTLNKAQRDAFCNGIDRVLWRLRDGELHDFDSDNWRATIEGLTACGEVYDELGWEEHGDRDSYMLTVRPRTLGLVLDVGEVTQEFLRDAQDLLYGPPPDCNDELVVAGLADELREEARTPIDPLLECLATLDRIAEGVA